MKRIFLALFIALLCMGSAQAFEIGEYAVTYDIQPSGQVVETLEISFSVPPNQTTQNSLRLGDIFGLAVKADGVPLQANLSREGGDTEVSFSTPAGTEKLLISFGVGNLVFRNGDIFQFFADLKPPPGNETITIRAILPRGFVLYRDLYFPSTAVIGTDGERITFTWVFQGSQNSLPLSIQYEPVFKSNQLVLPAVVGVSLAAVAGAFLFFRRKAKRDFLLTFFEDERKVVLALQEEKASYKNTMERKFGFSRAKMTRIVQKLERKGLVRKEKAGRTNRLHWKG